MLNKTPLHQTHLELKAQMTDFHGWSMPISYKSHIKEHLSVRKHCGIFDISHLGIIEICGSDARKFLQLILANDIKKTSNNSAMYSCMLNEDGGIIADLITYKLSADQYRLVINAGCAESNLNWIRKQAKDYDFNVSIQQLDDLAILALQGPAATSRLHELIDPDKLGIVKLLKPFKLTKYKSWMIAKTGYTGENGFEIILPKEQVVSLWKKLMSIGAIPCGLRARNTLRLEAGFNLYGKDMTAATSALCANLAWSVDLSDKNREFIGKDALLSEVLSGPAEHLIGLYLESEGLLKDGQILYCNDKPCGLLTSCEYSPVLDKYIALARIEHEYMPVKMYETKPSVTPTYFIKIEDEYRKVILVKPPFVKNGIPCLNPILSSSSNEVKNIHE